MKRLLIFLCLALMMPSKAKTQEALPIEQIPAAKVDIVLIQDESGSMESTDPRGVRRLATDFLVDNLSIAGEGNNLALILFGTASEQKAGLSRDFKGIRASAKEGLEFKRYGAQSHLTLETTPPRDYTDIFGALEMAYEMLAESGEKVVVEGEAYTKEKFVLFLTDGRIDPWPGNLDRYGDIARDYLEYIKDFPSAGRYKAGRRYKERVAAIDRERIEREIIERFKKRGWRMYTVGFSEGVDRDLLEELAFGTYGTPGIAKDYRELASILESVIPKAQNVIPLFVQDFCRTRSATGTTHIGTDIKAVLFKIDFSKMLEQDTSIRPENLLVILTDPRGGQIRSDREGFFTFNTDNEGNVLTVTYFKEHPVSGTWRIEVQGIGKDLCGKMDVEGRRKQFPYVRLDPDKEEYWEDSDVEVIGSLLGEGRNKLPIRKVEGRLRTPSRETVRLMFGEPDADNEARAKIKLNKGTGEYLLMVTITDEKYGTEIRSKGSVIQVVPVEPCVPIVTPKKIDLGVVGDKRSATFEGIKVDVGGFPKAVDIRVKKPVLERGITAIPVYWVKVHPEKGVATSQNPFRFNIEVELPKEVPSNIKDGIYKGNIIIESSLFEYPAEIPVEMEIKFPEIIIKGSSRLEKLPFDFWFMLSKPKEKTIKIGTTSLRDREITVSLSPNIKDTDGHNEERIAIAFADRPKTLHTKIRARRGEFTKMKIVASLLETRLLEGIRIPPGTYTGELRARGELMREVKVPIEIQIPEKPFILTLRWILFGLSVVCLGPIIGFGVKLRHLRRYGLLRGSVRLEKNPFFTVDQVGEGWSVRPTRRDVSVDGQAVDRGDSSPLNRGVKIEIGDRKNRKGFFRYRVRRISDKGISLKLDRSPYGSVGSYFIRKIFLWMVALGLFTWGSVWVWTNV